MGFLFLVKMTTYTKYKADAGWKEIKPVEIIRETDAFVFLPNGRREAKKSEYHTYCDTHEEAVQHIFSVLQKKVNDAKQTVVYWEVQIEKFTHKHNVQ